MQLELDRSTIERLIGEWELCEGDESYYSHLVEYLFEELEKQYPEMFRAAH